MIYLSLKWIWIFKWSHFLWHVVLSQLNVCELSAIWWEQSNISHVGLGGDKWREILTKIFTIIFIISVKKYISFSHDMIMWLYVFLLFIKNWTKYTNFLSISCQEQNIFIHKYKLKIHCLYIALILYYSSWTNSLNIRHLNLNKWVRRLQITQYNYKCVICCEKAALFCIFTQFYFYSEQKTWLDVTERLQLVFRGAHFLGPAHFIPNRCFMGCGESWVINPWFNSTKIGCSRSSPALLWDLSVWVSHWGSLSTILIPAIHQEREARWILRIWSRAELSTNTTFIWALTPYPKY